MFAVVFEVNPKPEQWDVYLGHARLLRPELERVDGFIDNERFSSLRRQGWLLSLSIWRDEKAVVRWRTSANHHEIQHKGRTEVFRDYRLRVGEITADNRLPAGETLREQRFDETAAMAKLISLTEGVVQNLPADPGAAAVAEKLGSPANLPGLDWDVFASIYQESKYVLLTSWRDGAAAAEWPLPTSGNFRRRYVRVIRDYGMFDRAEAPQYFPDVPVGAEP